MFLRNLLIQFGCVLALSWAGAPEGHAASCVWKVTSEGGGTIYLGGSVHALRSKDYPLPAAYDRALDASSRLILETDATSMKGTVKSLREGGEYPKGDSLKNHVDPRTYQYVRHFFALNNVSEEKFGRYRPWFIDLMLESPASENSRLGVEQYLTSHAQAKHKPVGGLENAQEHAAPFLGLSDKQSEALLLVFFINVGRAKAAGNGNENVMSAWRRGDTDTLAADMREAYQDFPAFNDRLINDRNRRWIPKIEEYLKSGQTVFVVAGAGHFGGNDGVLALLRGRGYHIEQL
jgi:hypothetical protein